MRFFALAVLFALGACAATPPAGVPAPPEDAPDQCRASSYQSFVGKNRSTLPAQPAGELWRVSCESCAVTMDYNPRRLNIVYDDDTGVIEKVSCG